MANTTPPSATNTRITINRIAADDIINATEASGRVTITGTVSGVYSVGDNVSLLINGVTYTGRVLSNGTYAIAVQGSDLAADSDRVIDVSLVARNSLGDTATITNSRGYSVDTSGPNAGSTSISVNAITADNIVNATEKASTVTVSGNVYGDFITGDTITLKINNVNYTARLTSSGSFTVNVKGTDLAADADSAISVSLVARDTAGNTATITSTKIYSVDLSGPTTATTNVSLDSITSDNIVGPSEAAGSVVLTGRVTGDYSNGNIVTLTINGTRYTGTVFTDGTFSSIVNGADLSADSDKVIDISLNASDTAGNTGVISSTKSYTVSNIEAGIAGISGNTVTEGSAISFHVIVNPATIAKEYSFYVGGGTLTDVERGTPTFTNGVTYSDVTGKITVPAGVTAFDVNISTSDDTIKENKESLLVTIADKTATAYVLDNDSVAGDSVVTNVSNPIVDEGANLNYIVTLNKTTTGPQLIDLVITGVSAALIDYIAPEFTNGVTFDSATQKLLVPEGVSSFWVSIPTFDDSEQEISETISVQVGGVTGVGTILDNDANTAQIRSVEIGNLGSYDDAKLEGASFVFNVVLNSASNQTTNAVFKIGGGTAGNTDYGSYTFSNGVSFDPVTKQLSIPAGVAQFSVTLNTIDDTIPESVETIPVTIGDKTVIATLIDTDSVARPVTIQSLTAQDGTEGGLVSYTVVLNSVTYSEQQLDFALSGNASNQDLYVPYFSNGVTYNATTGKITIPVGVDSFLIAYPIVDDSAYEGTESLTVTIAGSSAEARISDNELAPPPAVMSISSPGATEGLTLQYEVNLENSATTVQKYGFELGGGSAKSADYGTPTFTNGVTYDALTKSISVPAGVSSFLVNVPVVEDSIFEGKQSLPLTIGGVTGIGTIEDNEATPIISKVTGNDVNEGEVLIFDVQLNVESENARTFEINWGNGTATIDDIGPVTFTNGVTYDEQTNTITVPGGVTTFQAKFPTVVDDIEESGGETFYLRIGNATSEVPVYETGTGNITDNVNTNLPPSDGGYLQGKEDTPLVLSWSSFHPNSNLPNNSSIGIAVTSLPTDGRLTLNGNVITAGQFISKSDIDSGLLVFTPRLNASGFDTYNIAGEGNMKSDYTSFNFTVNNGSQALGTAVKFIVDMVPDADAPVGSIIDGSPTIYLNTQAYSSSRDDGYWVTTYSSQLNWHKITLPNTSSDNDGSEKHFARITVPGRLALSNGVDITGGQNATADAYYDWSRNEYVINTDVHSSVNWSTISGGVYAQAKYVTCGYLSNRDLGGTATVSVYSQEIDKDGNVLDTEIMTQNITYPFKEVGYSWGSPLVFDLNDDGVHTIDFGAGVEFNLLDQGTVKTGWVDDKDGLLALDLNHDGKINSGAELFGEATRLADGSKAKNGFEALGQYDANHDMKIDAQDDIYAELRMWVDGNSNGVTDECELHTLNSLGITSINLSSIAGTKVDNDNILGLTGSYTTADGKSHELADVYFKNESVSQLPSPPIVASTTTANDHDLKTSVFADTQQKADITSIEETEIHTRLAGVKLSDYFSTPFDVDQLLASSGLQEIKLPVAAIDSFDEIYNELKVVNHFESQQLEIMRGKVI